MIQQIQQLLVELISVLKDAVLLLKQAETLLEITNHVELEQELVRVKGLIKEKQGQIKALEQIIDELPPV